MPERALRRHLLLVSGTALSAHNGSSRVEESLAEALAFGPRYVVTLLTRDEACRDTRAFRHKLYQRPSSKPWKMWLCANRVSREIERLHRECPIDLVHGFGFFPVCLYVAGFAREAGVPFVLTHHSMDLLPKERWLKFAVRRALGRASRVTCLNEVQRAVVLDLGVAPDHAPVIPNGVDARERSDASLDAWPSSLPQVPDPFVLFAGRLEVEKGLHILLDAYASIPRGEAPTLVIAGDGRDAETVRARADALGARMLGWVPHDVLLAVMARASAVVIPSLTEAAPLLPLEAFALGVPVIVHDLPAIQEYIDPPGFGGPLAELIPLSDKAAWAGAISRARLPERPKDRLLRAHSFAVTLAWPSVARRYADLYEHVLAFSGRPTP